MFRFAASLGLCFGEVATGAGDARVKSGRNMGSCTQAFCAADTLAGLGHGTCGLKTTFHQAPQQLPTEILEEVLRYAGPIATARLASVDRRWHKAATSTLLWRDFYAAAPFATKVVPLPKAPPAGASWQSWYGAHDTVTRRMPEQIAMHRARLDAFESPAILESTAVLASQAFWTTLLIPVPIVLGAVAGAMLLTAGAGMLAVGGCLVAAYAGALAMSLSMCVVLWAIASTRMFGMIRICLPQLLNGALVAIGGACISALSFLTVQYFIFVSAVLATVSAMLGCATLVNAITHLIDDPTALGRWWRHRPLAAQHRRACEDLELTLQKEAMSLTQKQKRWTV